MRLRTTKKPIAMAQVLVPVIALCAGPSGCGNVFSASADELLGLTPKRHTEDSPELRFTRRLRDLSQVPEDRKRAVLKTLDDLIRANS